MNTPIVGEPPYPVVIALHGYISPEIYHTIDYTTRYADALAREGYLVVHPNLRGYPPSDEGDNLFRVGMAIDVLNLISLIKQQAGKPGPLSMADPDKIGIWGHSMGGGISTRVITISSDVRAAVLYGAMSGDEQQNFERIYDYFSNGERGMEELSFPEEAFERISPINYLERVRAAVSIHHGENDVDVPLTWSLDLCRRLRDLEKPVECYTYEDQPHTFHGEGDNLFIMQMVNFYNRMLRGE
jgi:dipeptidyl aminopeptidase/acylaminoacyl peptidase